MKNKVLESLYEKKGEFVSIDELTSQLGFEHSQILDHIKTLKKEGYTINISNDAFQLNEELTLILPHKLKSILDTSRIGNEIHYFREVDSTNEVAKKLAIDGAPEGTVVIAESQSKGRGRRGKKWISPMGGAWMSVILRPDILPINAPQLTFTAGVAAAKTLKDEYGLEVGIKWPNDILIDNKKVCGILTEISTERDAIDYMVIGIGIDVNIDLGSFPPELKDTATSIKSELRDGDVSRMILVQKFLENFEEIYNEFSKGNFHSILNKWREYSKTIGSSVEVKTGTKIIKGEAVGVNSDGALIVELNNGSLEKIISGECRHVA
ncbi:MAG: biotin--[acetyl-CoA-carboxylase] ligase [Methanobacterium sp.]|uniref:biotin--[acetyl-CoA-carboxylase] ligase n=1 Tax=Methanobacterium sp. TaxID=2164 RepID=UPI003D64891E|nr:biotin--[acetyl-CoA-carboxylase] ligase [Methanobacterium sp.]